MTCHIWDDGYYVWQVVLQLAEAVDHLPYVGGGLLHMAVCYYIKPRPITSSLSPAATLRFAVK